MAARVPRGQPPRVPDAGARRTPKPVWNPDIEQPIDFFEGWSEVPDATLYDNAFKIQWELYSVRVLDEPFPYDLRSGAKGVELAELGIQSWGNEDGSICEPFFLLPSLFLVPFPSLVGQGMLRSPFHGKAKDYGQAKTYLSEKPRTVTADWCGRVRGAHDFYSEGDYWWPNPEDSDGPYVRRDGETNPANFIAHRQSMIRLSELMGTLVSAYLITKEETYASKAVTHLRAWFVEPKTRMRPSALRAGDRKHAGEASGSLTRFTS